ncbi:Fic family protein [Sporosarcina sp. CAU 1771]
MDVLTELIHLKKELDNHRPLSSITLQKLKEDFLVRNTYHSNAIEGNTLTIYETKVIIEDGITVGGKSMREHLEAINHRDAILFLEDIISEPLTERLIKEIHQLILRGIDNLHAGVYRKQEVLISGASHQVTPAHQIKDEMDTLLDWYKDTNTLHPLEKACLLHSKFVNIHPFIDGNGRTSRLLMNLELIRHGYLPVTIQVKERQDYYEALDIAAVKQEYELFINLVATREKEALQQYISLLPKV